MTQDPSLPDPDAPRTAGPSVPAPPPVPPPPAAHTPPPAAMPVAPPPPAGAYPTAYPGGYVRQSSSKATTAMVLGIVGLVVCQLVGIAAIIVGNDAKREIDASGGQLDGRGMAVAGVVMGWVAVGLLALVLIIFALLFVAAVVSSPSSTTSGSATTSGLALLVR
jgi:hypothetical protein